MPQPKSASLTLTLKPLGDDGEHGELLVRCGRRVLLRRTWDMRSGATDTVADSLVDALKLVRTKIGRWSENHQYGGRIPCVLSPV